MAMQYAGATLAVMERFDAREALALCERYKVTHGHFVPTMMVRILKLPPEERLAFDLSATRIVMHGAAPCPPEVKQAMIEWLGPILEESYGGTEGNGMTMIGSQEWLEHPGSVGKPYTGAIHVVGPSGEDLTPGEIGLIYYDSGLKVEYHGNPEKTKEAFDDQPAHSQAH
jgi:fatty-acyl-CoA synthase